MKLNFKMTLALSAASFAGSCVCRHAFAHLAARIPRTYRTPVTIAALFAISTLVNVYLAHKEAANKTKSWSVNNPVPIDHAKLTKRIVVCAIASVVFGISISNTATELNISKTPAFHEYNETKAKIYATIKQCWHDYWAAQAKLAAATAHV